MKEKQQMQELTNSELQYGKSSISTFFFFFFPTYALHYTSIHVVEYCSLDKASIYPFFNHTQEFLCKWSQIMIRKPSYLKLRSWFNFILFSISKHTLFKELD